MEQEETKTENTKDAAMEVELVPEGVTKTEVLDTEDKKDHDHGRFGFDSVDSNSIPMDVE